MTLQPVQALALHVKGGLPNLSGPLLEVADHGLSSTRPEIPEALPVQPFTELGKRLLGRTFGANALDPALVSGDFGIMTALPMP